MAENNTKPDPDGERRRRLIKGAVAAGVGVAAYSAPSISAIPAYAQQSPALGSIDVKTGPSSVWFTPNMDMGCGAWKANSTPRATTVAIVKGKDVTTTGRNGGSITVTYSGLVPGNTSTVKIDGDPNNGTNATQNSNSNCFPAKVTFTSSGLGNCEMVIYGQGCGKNAGIGASGENSTGGPAQLVTTLQNGGAVNYCSNQPGTTGCNDMSSQRCFLEFIYEVRCTVN